MLLHIVQSVIKYRVSIILTQLVERDNAVLPSLHMDTLAGFAFQCFPQKLRDASLGNKAMLLLAGT